MSDDFQPSQQAGEANALPPELAQIYHRLEHDGTAWSRHVPDTAKLETLVTRLAAGIDPHIQRENTWKEFTPMKATNDYIDMPMNDRPTPSPVPTAQRPRSFIASMAAMLLVIMLAAIFVWRTQHHVTAPASHVTTPIASAILPPHAAVLATSLLTSDDIWGVGATFRDPTNIRSAATGFIVQYAGGQWHMLDDTDFPNMAMESITMLSDTEGWAVGRVAAGQATSAPYHMQDVVYHYTNGHWVNADIVIPDNSNGNVIIQATGHDDAWLLSSNGSDATLLHFSAGTWTALVTPATFDYFTMLSDSEGWFNQRQTLWHYQGGQWHNSYSVASKGANKSVSITQGSFTGPNDGWGLIYDDPNYNRQEGLPVLAVKTTIIHYDGTQWTPVALPSQLLPRPEYHIVGFAMRSPHDGWGLVDAMPNGNETIDENTEARYLVHYSNDTWSLVPTPAKITFTQIKMSSATDGWATGQRYDANGVYSEEGLPIILHYQAEVWSIVG